ncbi:hypothetical protein R9X47_04020 [Wukongibacter baidiensis]|uniref:hypothetical protein n=1 Tax=Wukongibacter baidiensis TaxID=1723361 RepID=UPI003D7F81E8
MKDTIKVVDITIQKKFKELVDAKREGKTYDFMIELKKELEATLEEERNNEHVEKIEGLLHEIEMRRVKKSYMQ